MNGRIYKITLLCIFLTGLLASGELCKRLRDTHRSDFWFLLSLGLTVYFLVQRSGNSSR